MISAGFKKIWLCGILLALLGLAFLWKELPDGKFHISFLDVGQGDSVFIESAESFQILVDGGPGNKVMQELAEVMPYFDREIDLVVLSHPHADHLDGLVEVAGRYKIKNALIAANHYEGENYKEFLQRLMAEGSNIWIAESGTDFKMGSVTTDVIFPIKSLAGKEIENLNNASVGLRIVYKEKSIVLTGDMEREAEAELIASGWNMRADIFKAGHHGSRTSSTPQLLNILRPEIVVIQCGEGNSFGHPHPETLRNFHRYGVKEIFRNDLDGRVEFTF